MAQSGCHQRWGGERPEGAHRISYLLLQGAPFRSSSHLAISVSHSGWWLSFVEMQHFSV